MELADVMRCAPELVGEGFQDPSREAGVGVEEVIERLSGQAEGDRVVERHRRGRARGTVEERQLAERLTRSNLGEDRLLAVDGLSADTDDAALDQVHGIAVVALVEEDLSPAEPSGEKRPGDEIEPFRGQRVKERRGGEGTGREGESGVVRHADILRRWR